MTDVLNHGGDGEMSLHINMQIGYRLTTRQEFFDINPRRYSKANYKLVVDGTEDTAARLYRQYMANVNAYIRDKGTALPYRGLTADVWEKCIERSLRKNGGGTGRAVNEHNVVLMVLGDRRGHRRAVERILRGTYRSHSSTMTLRDQPTTSQSTQATNALNSKMETYMQQMNEFIMQFYE
ncbi:Uncharacterized protein Adt_28110 [Abeliophyllum distichum]|uniref:Uncharacterized protein n=1 Tax=Abeliophyllum distichum TaxID=126358 RepID=A0ABD1RVP7_9LAMI